MQTVYNLFIIAILFSIIYNFIPDHRGYEFIKTILVFFWIGQSGMYIVNVFLYSDVSEWMNNFNNYIVLIPVYVGSLIMALGFTYGK